MVVSWNRRLGCCPRPPAPLAAHAISIAIWSGANTRRALWFTFITGPERHVGSWGQATLTCLRAVGQCHTEERWCRTGALSWGRESKGWSVHQQLASWGLRKPFWAPCSLGIEYRLWISGALTYYQEPRPWVTLKWEPFLPHLLAPVRCAVLTRSLVHIHQRINNLKARTGSLLHCCPSLAS